MYYMDGAATAMAISWRARMRGALLQPLCLLYCLLVVYAALRLAVGEVSRDRARVSLCRWCKARVLARGRAVYHIVLICIVS